MDGILSRLLGLFINLVCKHLDGGLVACCIIISVGEELFLVSGGHVRTGSVWVGGSVADGGVGLGLHVVA